MNFSVFAELYNNHRNLILVHFHHRKKNFGVYLLSLFSVPILGLRQPLADFLCLCTCQFWTFLGTYIEVMLGF